MCTNHWTLINRSYCVQKNINQTVYDIFQKSLKNKERICSNVSQENAIEIMPILHTDQQNFNLSVTLHNLPYPDLTTWAKFNELNGFLFTINISFNKGGSKIKSRVHSHNSIFNRHLKEGETRFVALSTSLNIDKLPYKIKLSMNLTCTNLSI